MPFTNFPYGVTSFGIPIVGSSGPSVSIPNSSGSVWFVDAVNGSDGNGGTGSADAFKTIGQAISKAGNGTGDTIYVYPGSYAENLVVSKDYLAIIGAVWAGYAKPDIEAAAGITLTVTGQGFMSRHCRYAGTADVVKQQGNGFLYSDCVFDGDGNGATTALVRLVPSNTNTHQTASEGTIQNCLFRGSGGFGLIFDTATAAVGVGSTDNLITGNIFRENTGVDIATKNTGAVATYSVEFTVIGQGNIFEDKNKATYIDFTTTNAGGASKQSGTVDGNIFCTDTMSTTIIKAVGTAFTFPGNADNVGIFDGSGLD
jgi:hypothetical protein